MVKQGDILVAQANQDAVREMSNETDRHSLLLILYASELDRPGITDEEITTLLQEWSKVPGGLMT